MTMDCLTRITLLAVLIIAVVIEKVSSSADNPCEVSAPEKCTTQNYQLIKDVQSSDANAICRSYQNYRDCLDSHSTTCRDKDFILVLMDRACNGRCFGCAGAGLISGSLSTVIILGTLATVYLTGIF